MHNRNSRQISTKPIKKKLSLLIPILLILTICLNGTTLKAWASGDGPIAVMIVEANGVTWQPTIDHAGLMLIVSGPDGLTLQQDFGPGSVPTFASVGSDGQPLPNGSYTYELRATPVMDPTTRAALEAARESGDSNAVLEELRRSGKLPEMMVQSGYFAIKNGSFVTKDISEPKALDLPGETTRDKVSADPAGDGVDGSTVTPQDVVHYDDLIVTSSLCVGFDCVNGESFGFDTVRLKENNLRIKFQDTSSTGSFPTNDWEITINDSVNGGASYFGIQDVDAGRWPFKIEAGAPSNALYVEDYGRVGLGTSTPVVELHIKDSDTPSVRLEQDSSGGWTAQTWDVAGNESNFFIRDATHGSKLPFRIQPGAPSSSLSIKSDGKVGIGTWSPNWILHAQDDSSTDMRIRLDNTSEAATTNYTGFDFAVMTSARTRTTFYMQAGFSDTNDATRTSHVRFRSYDDGSVQDTLTFSGGDVGIGTSSPNFQLEVDGSAGKPGGGSWSDSSDARLKKDIFSIDGREALDLLGQLQGVTFNWINPEEHSPGTRAGVVAQELEEVFPDWVEEYEVQGSDAALIPEGEKAKAVHFPHDFNAYAIEAIKALDAENQTLSATVQEQTAAIETLQQQNADLEARLDALEKAAGPSDNQTSGLPMGGLFLGSLVIVGLVVNQYRKQ